jgi:hypothetical protein
VDIYANSEDLEESDRGDDQAFFSFVLWRAAAGWNRGETGYGSGIRSLEFRESVEFSEPLEFSQSSGEGMGLGRRVR